MNVLVAAPTCRKKGYSLPQWVAATKGHDRLFVTEEEDYVDVLEGFGLPVATYVAPPLPDDGSFRHEMATSRFNAAWRVIIDFAKATNHTHILSLESDIIPPDGVDIVDLMVKNWDGKVDFLVHLYPYRTSYNRPGQKCWEMGCTMATTELWDVVLKTLPESVPLYWAVYQTPERNPRYHFTNKRIEPVQLQHLEEAT